MRTFLLRGIMCLATIVSVSLGSVHAHTSEIGVNISNIYYDGAHGISPGMLDAIKRSGVSWVRINLLWGWTVEKSPGQFDWTGLDAGIDALRAAHIKVLMIVEGPVPCWGLEGGPPSDCKGPAMTIPDPVAWQSFVTTAAKRFRGRVAAWEIWNEPDLISAIARPDITDANRLTLYRERILIPAARAIRAADPGALIVAGALSVNIPATAPEPRLAVAIRSVLDGVAPGTVDALSIHVYSQFDLTSYGRTARSTLDAIGLRNMPIWLTETGVTVNQGPSGQLPDEALVAQTAFIRGSLTSAAHSGLFAKIFWFALTDSNDWHNLHADGYGLMRDAHNAPTLTPRPAFDALRALAAKPGP